MKNLNKYFVVLDSLMIFTIFVFVESLTLKFTFEIIQEVDLIIFFALVTVLKIILNHLFKLYNRIWALASIEDLVYIAYSFVISNALVFIVLSLGLVNFTLLKLMAVMFLEICGYLLSRFAIRYYFYRKQVRRKDLKNAMIIGAGKAGDLVFRDIQRHQARYGLRVVGFIDDSPKKIGSTLKNVPIFGPVSETKFLIDKNVIDTIILAIPSLRRERLTEIINHLSSLSIKTLLLPPLEDIKDGYDISKVRTVSIEDLLGRDPVDLDDTGIEGFISGKTILVTGGGGTIGSEICRQVVNYKAKRLLIFDIYENGAYVLEQELKMKYEDIGTEVIVLIGSVQDEARLKEIFAEYKPEVVFHAAAHKHVPLMEVSPKEAVKNNVFGTLNVAKEAVRNNIEKFVLISTDKAVNPTNYMGASKRFAELIIQYMDSKSEASFSAVRFGNVLGSSGSVIPLFKRQIEMGGPITVTHKDIQRYFMTIPESCQLVLQSGAFASGGEIFVLDMGEPVKILELAEKMIRLSGFIPYDEININFTGLRPGEKMFEELFISSEEHIKTPNKRIFIEKNGSHDKSIDESLEMLRENHTKIFEVIEG